MNPTDEASTANGQGAPETRFASPRGLLFAAIAASSVIAASTAGRVISAKPVAGWYRTLEKPWFNPPNWAFPVAWSLLFVLMGIAFWRVLRAAPSRARTAGVVFFSLQLVLNVGWSLAFFGARSPLAGLVVILPFWALILATLLSFRKADRTAGALLVPYIAWVSFAIALNVAIVRLN